MIFADFNLSLKLFRVLFKGRKDHDSHDSQNCCQAYKGEQDEVMSFSRGHKAFFPTDG
jgi:hypothetical protein